MEQALHRPQHVTVAISRRLPVGAELVEGGADFRVWAPRRRSVRVVIGDREQALERDGGGYFRGVVAGAAAGTRYRFRLDDERETYPDPASRFQPEGPHGASEIVDPSTYRWRTTNWRGVTLRDAVLYEMHAGTFTPEGTWRAAIGKLPHLRDLGVTVIEVMPVAEFPGRFGWGYDGVDLFAPSHLYGRPDDFRAFVDAAHAHGIGVILGDGSEGVRELFAANAAYWIGEFRLDGLRLDATQSIHDASAEHIVTVICRSAPEAAGRPIVGAPKNEGQKVQLLHEDGVDALWNDDWHHSAVVAAGGLREAYYTDYFGTPRELVSMARHGFLYQGQRYSWQKHRRGSPSLDIPPEMLPCFPPNPEHIVKTPSGARRTAA